MVPVSPYGPALGSEVEKNPDLISTSGKKHKLGRPHGDKMAVYGKYEVVFLEKYKFNT
jgi:hypothetical protein